MIITVDSRRASVLDDEATAQFSPSKVISDRSAPATGGRSRTMRAVVEILRRGGGMMPRALVGGAFTPGGNTYLIEVQTSGVEMKGAPSCRSELWRPLSTGMPDEFADAVLAGLLRAPLPAGRLLVDRAAYDMTESSPLAFQLAAELLAKVLAARMTGGNIEHAVRQTIQTWP